MSLPSDDAQWCRATPEAGTAKWSSWQLPDQHHQWRRALCCVSAQRLCTADGHLQPAVSSWCVTCTLHSSNYGCARVMHDCQSGCTGLIRDSLLSYALLHAGHTFGAGDG